MTTIKTFDDFIEICNSKEILAGVAVVCGNAILLVHPTNASWQKNALGIPKGHVKEGEEIMNAAVREFNEETGLNITTDMLEPDPKTSPKYEGNKIKSVMVYYTMYIKDPRQIGMNSYKIEKERLQLNEVDWAGFIPIMDAYSKIHKAQTIILDRLKK